jgi:hypothetical protein
VTRAKNKLEIFDYESVYGEKCETASFVRHLLGIEKNAKLKARAEKSKKELSPDFTSITEKTAKTSVKATRKKIQTFMPDEQISTLVSQYRTGMRVEHKTYGKGTIEELRPPICRILVDGGEIRSFDIVYCINNSLISPCK